MDIGYLLRSTGDTFGSVVGESARYRREPRR
jgi:hypothetical protein